MPAAIPAPHLSIRLLGGFELRGAGQPAPQPGYDKGRALLAYLATEAGPHARQKLAAMLWPALAPEAARTNLRQVVLNLRRVLGEGGLQADRESIGIAAGAALRIDVAEFTAPAPSCIARPTAAHCEPCVAQMEHMAACYRGEFMAGFLLPDCPDFHDWLHLKREALHRHALAVLARLSDCLEQAGAVDRALPYALRHAALDPWNEAGQRRVMRLQMRHGNAAGALRQYEGFRRVLARELGVRPEQATQDLAQHIRDGQLTPATVTSPPPAPRLAAPRAERRQLTILYCELAAPGRHDPEEAMAALAAPQARCAALLQQGGGHVVRRHAGGLLAYFGFPAAREDAALAAIGAALAVAGESSHEVEIRLGVHTGMVVTGDDPLLPDAVGTASALAIRLRNAVAPGEVAVSADSLRLARGYFAAERCATLGGLRDGDTVEAYRILRRPGACGRPDAPARLVAGGSAQLRPLLGRERELEALARAWQGVRSTRRGNAMLLQGEAGLGKSRLLLSLKRRLEPDAALHELHCGPALAPAPQREQALAALRQAVEADARSGAVLLLAEDLHRADAATLQLLGALVVRARALPLLLLLTARPEFHPPWDVAACTTLAVAGLGDADIAALVRATAAGLAPAAVADIVARADGVPLFAEELARAAAAADAAAIPPTLRDLLAARLDALGEAKRVAQLAATIGREFGFALLAAVCDLPSAALRQALDALHAAGVLAGEAEGTQRFKQALMHEAAYDSQLKADRRAVHGRIAQALRTRFIHMAEARPEVVAHHLARAGGTAAAAD